MAMKKKKLTKSYILCSKCGNKKKTAKKQMERLISTFGSLENVHAKYHCIECRREYNVRKDGRPKPVKVPRKKKEDNFERDEEGRIQLPDWMRAKRGNDYVSEPRTFKCPEGMDKKEFNAIVAKVAKKFFIKRG